MYIQNILTSAIQNQRSNDHLRVFHVIYKTQVSAFDLDTVYEIMAFISFKCF